MRKKQKHFSRLLFGLLGLFLIGITFGGCEAEKEFASKSNIIVKHCSMKDFALQSNVKLKQAVNQLESLKSNSNVNARAVYDEMSGLYYDDEKGIFISKDGKDSYTFPIIQTAIDEKLKNITFNKNVNNEYDIYIVNYDYTKQDLSYYTKEELAEREIKYQALLKNGIVYPVESQWFICVEITTIVDVYYEYHEGEGPNGAGVVIQCLTLSISTICESGGDVGPPSSGGGDGSGAGDGSGPGSPGGGGPGDGSNPDDGATTPINNEAENEIITTPVVPGLASDIPEIDDPCAKLKVLLTNDGLNLRAEIDYLEGMINNPSNENEHAVSVTKRINEETGSPEYRPGQRIELDPNGGEMPTGGYIIGGVHCHTPKGYSMFTYEDVNSLKNLYDSITTPQRKKEVFFMLVAKNKESGAIETYSILVEDIEKLVTEINNKLNSPEVSDINNLPLSDEEKVNRKLFKLSKLNADQYPNENQEILETIFLQQFATFGISIYKANQDLTNWTKLEQPENPTDTQPKKTPCN